VLRTDLELTTLRANTPAGWITFGFNESVDEAVVVALNDMLDLVMSQFDLVRKDALALISVAADLRITQLVNGVRGIHVILPHGAIEAGS
jgi:acetamidase/formamidase